MVKKRFCKKYSQISSDESDSDDFYEEKPAEAQPKKYSLRKRRGANFAEDFDYEMEENDNNMTGTEILRSDDEDFDLNNVQVQKNTTSIQLKSIPKTRTNVDNVVNTNCIITKFKERELEPEIPKDKQSSSDMIDFEDVIKADILVNKSRIDYDSIIEKTEIKIKPKEPEPSPDGENQKPLKIRADGEPAKKRGRKPKKISGEMTDKQSHKRQKGSHETYEVYTNESTGLPINSVLGVTESLYELAERYHMQGGMMMDEMEPLQFQSISNEHVSTESMRNAYLDGDNEVPLQQSEAASGAIEIY